MLFDNNVINKNNSRRCSEVSNNKQIPSMLKVSSNVQCFALDSILALNQIPFFVGSKTKRNEEGKFDRISGQQIASSNISTNEVALATSASTKANELFAKKLQPCCTSENKLSQI